MKTIKYLLSLSLCLSLLTACSGGGSNDNVSNSPDSNNNPVNTSPVDNSPVDNSQPNSPPTDFDISVLMIGNSHTSTAELPALLQNSLQAYAPDGDILVEKAEKSLFLSEHVQDSTTMAHFESRNWDYVILQAQKYSVSRSYEYSTQAAQTLISKTKQQGGIPILFPEWGQLNSSGEATYVYSIHSGIAEQNPACIAPVGFAWDYALTFHPSLSLHARDGNHANETGAYLTSMVLFQSITGHPAELLGEMPGSEIEGSTQLFLQQMASQAIVDHPPCESLTD